MYPFILVLGKGGFKSEDTGEFLHLQHKYSQSLFWAENLNFPPKTVNNLFKFPAQDSDFEYLCWRRKNFPVSSELKPPLGSTHIDFFSTSKGNLEKGD